jgi:fatty-acyl-CoA synthase
MTAGFLAYARATPERIAISFADTGETASYGALDRQSQRLAAWLEAQGLGVGASVAMLIGNRVSLFEVYWATQRSGHYLTPLNWHATAEELAYILDDADADALIVDAALAELAEALAANAPARVRVMASLNGAVPGFADLDKALPLIIAPPDRPVPAGSVMIYSSGTTGRPKGIRRPLPTRAIDDSALVEAATLVMRTFGFTSADTYLCPAPLYHAGPLRSCTAMQMMGATVVGMQRFDAAAALAAISRHHVTVAQFVPTHFKRMLDLPVAVRAGYDLSSLRVAVHAAAPCPPAVKRAMIDWWGPILLEYYAGTEGGGTMISSADWLNHPGAVGKPWAGLEVAVLAPDGALVCTPELEGPIYFRNTAGGLANFAYHKDAEKTANAYRGDWFTLGDIGRFDADGFLYLTDRACDMIISGGVNIYPQEVENLLMAHPAVREVAVIGTPDVALGEVATAVVELKPGVTADGVADQLIAYCRGQLALYKCPRQIEIVSDLPRTETGKLQKRLVRARYWPTGSAIVV